MIRGRLCVCSTRACESPWRYLSWDCECGLLLEIKIGARLFHWPRSRLKQVITSLRGWKRGENARRSGKKGTYILVRIRSPESWLRCTRSYRDSDLVYNREPHPCSVIEILNFVPRDDYACDNKQMWYSSFLDLASFCLALGGRMDHLCRWIRDEELRVSLTDVHARSIM